LFASRRFFAYCALFLLFGPVLCSFASNPIAIAGTLDLRGYDFGDSGLVSLSGEWEFYWDTIVTPENYQEILNRESDRYVKVPAYWDQYASSDSGIEARGVATYLLTIITDPFIDSLAFRIPHITPNAKIFLNGASVLESGHVSSDPKLSKTGSQIVIIPVEPSEGSIVLAISISNFHNVNGGINRPVFIGEQNRVIQDRSWSLVFDSLFLGGLLLVGLFHITVYLFDRKNRAMLFISILCFFAFGFAGFKSEMALMALFPGISGEIRTKFIYIILTLATPALALYGYSLYPMLFRKEFNWFVCPPAILYSVVVLVTPSSFYTHFLLLMEVLLVITTVYTMLMLFWGYRKSKKDVSLKKDVNILLYLGGIAFLFASIIFGVIDNEQTFVPRSIAGVFATFLLYQAYLHAYAFSSAFRRILKLKERNNELFNLTFTDSLTGICNRNLMNNYLASTWRVNSLTQRHIGLILVDLDNFVYYNNYYGRRQGDLCISTVSQLIEEVLSNLDRQDTLARFAGEKFAIVASDANDLDLYKIAESVRETIESQGIEHRQSKVSEVVTVSVGVACVMPTIDEDPDTIIEAAEKALYQAKSNGHNRTVSYSEEHGDFTPDLSLQ